MRLAKYLAHLGLCSRREADRYIEQGWVRVEGEVARLACTITPQQMPYIELDDRLEQCQSARVTIILNKPVGYVSGQAEKGYVPAVTLVTPSRHWRHDPTACRFHQDHLKGLAPAGRLDIDSTGLLVLTQDGRVAKALVGEDSSIEKEYLVRVCGQLSKNGLERLNHGLKLDGVALKPAQVFWQNQDQLRFILRQGKKRQIRRMCAQVGLQVTALKRVRIGQLNLADLPLGQWRYLRALADLEGGLTPEEADAWKR